MKSFFVCSILLLFSFNWMNPGSLSAQQLVAYSMTRIDVSTQTAGGRVRVNNLGLVRVGEGYIHDQNGLIGNGTLDTTYSIYDLADIPGDWNNLVLHNGNDDGFEVVGRIIDPVGVMRGFYVNLSIVNPQTDKSDFQLLPDLGSPISAARAINNDGDIAVQYQLPDGSWSVYITNRQDLNLPIPLGYEIANSWPFHMNNRQYDPVTGDMIRNAQLMVELPNGDTCLYTIGDPISEVKNLDALAGVDIQCQDLNDLGDVSGRTIETQVVPDKGKKTKTIIVSRAMLFESPFVSAPVEVGGVNTSAWGTNNAGDVVGDPETASSPAFLTRDGVYYDLDDYVSGDTEDLQFWFGRNGLQTHDINERGVTGFGQIVVSVTQNTGKGRNRILERRLYLLSPVVQ